MQDKISVVVADDHTVFREVLLRYFATIDSIEVICGVSDGAEAIQAVIKHEPNVMVLDLTMPNGNGVDVIRTVVGMGLKTQFVVLTMHDNPAMRRVALSAGAHAYLTKSASSAELMRTVVGVARGTIGESPDATAGNREDELAHTLAVVDGQLSKREREVLTLVGGGYTSKEIASVLEISSGTVDNYRTRIGNKLGVRGRAAMVRTALLAGLVSSGFGTQKEI